MGQLLAAGTVEVLVENSTLGLVERSRESDIYYPDAPAGRWLRPAEGLVHAHCPSDVIDARVRVELWQGDPPGIGTWSHSEEAEVFFPAGGLCIYTLGEILPTDIELDAPGRYGMRMSWALNPEHGPFHSPFNGQDSALEHAAAGNEVGLEGVDQYCLAQVWYLDSHIGLPPTS
ncbi:hypothetical protein [Streptomyces odontomachi]|uniref:hypothetical protein n=1 Tax=Streptomyces odontomachi TaxID=2944940 RepID=UPI00210E1669|nr:hypothetical protein [Streptomyces sp. ODS25]